MKSIVPITKEEYLKYKDAGFIEMSEFVEEIARHSRYHPGGYSFFRPKVFENDGEYFAGWEHYNSCD